MMRQYELVERVTAYKPNADEALLNKAYVYAMKKHGEQKRASGDPYFSHPLEVAGILTDLHLDEETIAVALLHDTIEDTDATRKEIDSLFGEKIGVLVEGLTKLKKLDLVSKKAEQSENLRRLLLAVSDDIRVLLVKLADRLHNMRTLGPMRADKRRRIANETLDIYAPLAGRMGMQSLRDELEDLSFAQINPEAHKRVTARLAEMADENRNLISTITQDLTKLLHKNGIKAQVFSRQKKPFSVFRKMESKAIALEQLSDIYGFRVVVETVEECYKALGVVHTNWKMVPTRFKDFISVPKQNDYRSIHTTIIGPSRQRVELQIRTREMHEVAEYGIAAHTLYKDGKVLSRAEQAESNAYASLRKTIEQLVESDNSDQFLEHTKLELFMDQVFCFTPKGGIIALPKGATPIDFAYAVHTQIGNSCIGCKINGKVMPVITKLKNGDEVEIVRSTSQTPPSAWENVVVTGKARAAIRRASRQAVLKQYSGLGARILERSFDAAGKTFDRDSLKASLHRLARDSVEDVLADVGRNEITAKEVIRAVHPDWQDERVRDPQAPREEGWFNVDDGTSLVFRVPGESEDGSAKKGLSSMLRGIGNDLPVRFADCGAVPGDRIVGIVEPGRDITIYPIQAEALTQFDDQPEHWLDVRWEVEENSTERFVSRIKVTARNQPGTLATVSDAIANHDGNIRNLTMEINAANFAEMLIDLEVWDLAHLNRILRQVEVRDAVAEAVRIYD